MSYGAVHSHVIGTGGRSVDVPGAAGVDELHAVCLKQSTRIKRRQRRRTYSQMIGHPTDNTQPSCSYAGRLRYVRDHTRL